MVTKWRDTVLIVGGGVFGQVIAAKLRREGHAVTVFDRQEPEAGSLPSGGHLKPSWLTDIPGKALEAALVTLQTLFGMETLECDFGRGGATKKIEIQRVDVPHILAQPVERVNVTHVGDGWVEIAGPLAAQGVFSPCERIEGKLVVVAAGVWSKQLLPRQCRDLIAKRGVSWVFTGGKPVPNIIWPWAPFKQVVRTEHGPGRTWIGDGSALLPASWTTEREAAIYSRIKPHAPPNYTKLDRQYGLRPYLNDGLLRVSPKLWLATGGAKSGTALAAVAANTIAKALR